MTLPRRPLAFLLGAGLAVGGAGCSNSSDVTGTGATQGTYIRFVQAASDAASGVDVAVNGSLVVTGLAFASAAPNALGQYGLVPATPQLAFYTAGSTTAFYNQTAAKATANGLFTVVTYGRVASGGAPAATAAVLADTMIRPPAGVLVRVFNAVDYVTTGSGTPVNVFIYPQGSARPNTPDVSSVAYGTPSAYVTEAAGTLQVDVFAAGATTTGTPLFTGTLAASGGAIRTLVLSNPPTAGASAGASGSVLVLIDPTT